MTAPTIVGLLQQATDAPLILDPRDHMGSARAMVRIIFTDITGRRTLHRHRGAFYEWSGAAYREVNDEGIKAHAWGFLDKAMKLDDEGKAQPFKPNKTSVANVVEALGAISQIDVHLDPPFWLGRDDHHPPPREIFACGNGLLHVPTGKLLSATPDYFNLSASDVAFNPNAPKPERWIQFLEQLHNTDTAAIETEQELFGYALTPDTSLQKIGLWVGPKRGGKGTIARVLTALIGRQSVANPTMASLSANFGLWPLIGKNLAIVSDARIGPKTDKAAIAERLLSISGEDQLTIDRKFLTAWTGHLTTRLYVMSNIPPSFSDSSGALASRFIIIMLTQSFYGKEDPKLTDKLKGELSGILNWAIEGYRRLHKRSHFVQPRSAGEVVEMIELLGAPVKAFVNECCKIGVGLTVKKDVLYAAWTEWCRLKGLSPSADSWFGRDLFSAVPGLGDNRPRDGEDRPRVYEGIALLNETLQKMKSNAADAVAHGSVQAIRDRQAI